MSIVVEPTGSKIQFSEAGQVRVLSGDVTRVMGETFIAAGSEEFEDDYTLTLWSDEGLIFEETASYALIDDTGRLAATYSRHAGCVTIQDGVVSLKIQLNRNSDVPAATYTLARLIFSQ